MNQNHKDMKKEHKEIKSEILDIKVTQNLTNDALLNWQ